MQYLYRFAVSDRMKKEFIYGLILGTIITILIIGSMEYTRQTKPKGPSIEIAKGYGCMELVKQNCEVSTNFVIIKNYDTNKDGKIDSSDTLFELCKNYFSINTDSECKAICGCLSEQNKETAIADLIADPQYYVNKTVIVTGFLRNRGSNYYTNPHFVIEDDTLKKITVTEWAPLEYMQPPPGSNITNMPKAMDYWLNKRLRITGIFRCSETECYVDVGFNASNIIELSPCIFLTQSDKEVSCTVNFQTSFDLFDEPYQDTAKCELIGVPPVTSGCFLRNISYDKVYTNELESKVTGDCWATRTHRFIGIRKGDTEIITEGTCEYNRTYKIHIV